MKIPCITAIHNAKTSGDTTNLSKNPQHKVDDRHVENVKKALRLIASKEKACALFVYGDRVYGVVDRIDLETQSFVMHDLNNPEVEMILPMNLIYDLDTAKSFPFIRPPEPLTLKDVPEAINKLRVGRDIQVYFANGNILYVEYLSQNSDKGSMSVRSPYTPAPFAIPFNEILSVIDANMIE